MSRRFLPWQKKRGHRRTGNSRVGYFGEGLGFGLLLLTGSTALVALITSRIIEVPGMSSLTTGQGLWLCILVLASFILIGIDGLTRTVLGAGTTAERRDAIVKRASEIDVLNEGRGHEFPTVPRFRGMDDSPGVHLAFRLPSATRPKLGLLSFGILTVMADGLLAALVVIAILNGSRGNWSWFLFWFILPLAYLAYRLTRGFLFRLRRISRLGVTNLEVSNLPLYPGQRYDVCVIQGGRMELDWLRIQLACDEQATVRDGTDVLVTDRRVVLHNVIHCKDIVIEPGQPFTHSAELVVPEDAMHTFQANSNSVLWSFVLEGKLRSGTKFRRQFPVVVYPAPIHTPYTPHTPVSK